MADNWDDWDIRKLVDDAHQEIDDIRRDEELAMHQPWGGIFNQRAPE